VCVHCTAEVFFLPCAKIKLKLTNPEQGLSLADSIFTFLLALLGSFKDICQVRFVFRFIFGWKAESIIALI